MDISTTISLSLMVIYNLQCMVTFNPLDKGYDYQATNVITQTQEKFMKGRRLKYFPHFSA